MMKMPALREKAALASFPICTLSGSTALITRCTHAYYVAGEIESKNKRRETESREDKRGERGREKDHTRAGTNPTS